MGNNFFFQLHYGSVFMIWNINRFELKAAWVAFFTLTPKKCNSPNSSGLYTRGRLWVVWHRVGSWVQHYRRQSSLLGTTKVFHALNISKCTRAGVVAGRREYELFGLASRHQLEPELLMWTVIFDRQASTRARVVDVNSDFWTLMSHAQLWCSWKFLSSWKPWQLPFRKSCFY